MGRDKITAAYLLANKPNGTLYVGSTRDLIERVWLHRSGQGAVFTRRYGVTQLVWFQAFALVTEARAREYDIKKWRRAWKISLIEETNPNWADLYPKLA